MTGVQMEQASELLLQQLAESTKHVDKEVHWLQHNDDTRAHKKNHLVAASSFLQDGPYSNGPYTAVHLPFLDEEVASDMSDWVMNSKSAAIIGMSVLGYAGCATCAAMMFFRFKRHPPRIRENNPTPLVDGKWRYGLFNCCDDPALCAFATCCCCILWADTVRMSNFFYPPRFCQAFTLITTLLLGVVCAVFAIMMGYVLSPILLSLVVTPFVLVFFRQGIRRLFTIDFCSCISLTEDCFTYCLCSVCAVVQESRQLDAAYQSAHVAVRLPLHHAPQQQTPMSSVASPTPSNLSPQQAGRSPPLPRTPGPPTPLMP